MRLFKGKLHIISVQFWLYQLCGSSLTMSPQKRQIFIGGVSILLPWCIAMRVLVLSLPSWVWMFSLSSPRLQNKVHSCLSFNWWLTDSVCKVCLASQYWLMLSLFEKSMIAPRIQIDKFHGSWVAGDCGLSKRKLCRYFSFYLSKHESVE